MSAGIAADPNKSASKKKKKGKKKANGKLTTDGAAHDNSDAQPAPPDEDDDVEDEDAAIPLEQNKPATPQPTATDADEPMTTTEPPAEVISNGLQSDVPDQSGHNRHVSDPKPMHDSSDATARFDALQQERDTLRSEVSKLRQSLESLQNQHGDEVAAVKEELEQSQQEKEHAETQYHNLLGKVNTIRSQLGERLKADAAELEQARARIDDLEKAERTAQEDNKRLQDSVVELTTKMKTQDAEIETLRSRTSLSTSNWAKERDEMVSREAYLREEYDVARQAMQDWEILATEERARREALEEKASDLEDQLNEARESHARVKSDGETQSNTIEGLQRALRELQEERRRELRELVERSEAQLSQLREQAKSADDAAASLKEQLTAAQKELDRALPFEKEVREKNLLIGKLRHEAVILNDHLTKALRFLKRGKPEDNVDRQLITNHFLHFLALDRSDPKKFQVLQLIAALLGWDDQQKEQAGLVRQGAGTGTLKLPMSPFRRTPSTPTLSSDYMPGSPGGGAGGSGTGKESLAELWSDFLEREAEAGEKPGSPSLKHRSPSISSQQSVMSPLSGVSQARLSSPEAKRGST